MPGENEKQPGQAPEQIPPGWRQYVRRCSEHPSSAGGDGRRVECFAVGGELATGLGSGQAGICSFSAKSGSILSLPVSPTSLNPVTLQPQVRTLMASDPSSSTFNVRLF